MNSVIVVLLRHCLQFLVCKRKLESKKEALLILSKELDMCQQERDQYKLMANQLRERHQGLKKKYRELIVSGPGALIHQSLHEFGITAATKVYQPQKLHQVVLEISHLIGQEVALSFNLQN